MLEKLEIFRVAQGLATHAAARQAAVARNVAHADTPGYRARDIAPFSETYRAETNTGMRATRAGHNLSGTQGISPAHTSEILRPGALSPNGNSVSLETEMMMSAEVQRDHGLALSVYRTSLNILRASLGRG